MKSRQISLYLSPDSMTDITGIMQDLRMKDQGAFVLRCLDYSVEMLEALNPEYGNEYTESSSAAEQERIEHPTPCSVLFASPSEAQYDNLDRIASHWNRTPSDSLALCVRTYCADYLNYRVSSRTMLQSEQATPTTRNLMNKFLRPKYN